MGGADEEVLPLFKIAGGGVIELLLAVVAEHCYAARQNADKPG
jgi:hypothetical protein